MTGLLFFRPRHLLGRAIDVVTHRRNGAPNVVHVAVGNQDISGGWFAVEAVAFHGVRGVFVPEGLPGVIFIPIDHVDLDALEDAACRVEGAGYDWLAYPALLIIGLLGFVGIRLRRNPVQARRRWFCSELAVYLLHQAGVTLPVGNAAAVSPQRLLNALWEEAQ